VRDRGANLYKLLLFSDMTNENLGITSEKTRVLSGLLNAVVRRTLPIVSIEGVELNKSGPFFSLIFGQV
jgi:hypothetical protein